MHHIVDAFLCQIEDTSRTTTVHLLNDLTLEEEEGGGGGRGRKREGEERGKGEERVIVILLVGVRTYPPCHGHNNDYPPFSSSSSSLPPHLIVAQVPLVECEETWFPSQDSTHPTPSFEQGAVVGVAFDIIGHGDMALGVGALGGGQRERERRRGEGGGATRRREEEQGKPY